MALGIITRREKFFSYNTLLCLVQALEEKITTIDLRNESCVYGRIDQVDGYMNIVMTNVIFIDPRGDEFPFEKFFVKARNIRYVHIPDELEIVPTIKAKLQGMRTSSRPQPRTTQRTFKNKRLMESQAETLRMVQDIHTARSNQEKKTST